MMRRSKRYQVKCSSIKARAHSSDVVFFRTHISTYRVAVSSISKIQRPLVSLSGIGSNESIDLFDPIPESPVSLVNYGFLEKSGKFLVGRLISLTMKAGLA